MRLTISFKIVSNVSAESREDQICKIMVSERVDTIGVIF